MRKTQRAGRCILSVSGRRKKGYQKAELNKYGLKKFDILRFSGYNKDETRAFPLGGERPFVLYSDRIWKKKTARGRAVLSGR
ncbi:MAG TPA: hypothetical protein H9695_12670 [Candidatus Mediterraneibacter excrementigallinarum]|nr:hypothetical protein [Candidatus Mediterraneibacter excrementigallinarum]